MKKWILLPLLFLISTTLFAKENLIFAVDLIRHGDRTPIYPMPTAPHVWTEGEGQLTALGMQQEFELGTMLRKKYVDETHLLPPSYQGNTLYVRSDDYDRTLMSAAALLMGLYPPGTGAKLDDGKFALPNGYQLIPIHTVALRNENLMVPDKDPAAFKALMTKYVYHNPAWLEKTKEARPYFGKWSRVTGVHIVSLEQLISLGDDLYIYQLHQVSMPQGLSSDDINKIIRFGREAMVLKFAPKEIGKTACPLVDAIGKYLQQGAAQKTPLKYVLLSGHDSTILAVMSALGKPLNEAPPYASDLNFALVDLSEKGQHDLRVKVTLNGRELLNEKAQDFKPCANEVKPHFDSL